MPTAVLQVNGAMNEVLRETVRAQLDDLEVRTLLDACSPERATCQI